MELVYVLINVELEDMIVILSKEQAIEASKKYPHTRVEIFRKNELNEYTPTYDYYKNGVLF